ncbi:hypothetical protein JCM9279_006136 [Rhodotorula babjevae]
MLAFSRTSLLLLGLLPLCLVLPVFAQAQEQRYGSVTRSVVRREPAAMGWSGKVGGSSAGGLAGTEGSASSWDVNPQVELAEDDKLFSLAHDGPDSTAGPTNGRELRASPTAVKPDLPLFVIQVLVTAGYSSGIVRTATARAEAAFNPQQEPATSGVVAFVCKSLGLFVTLLVTAVVVFLASGPGL